MAISLQNLRSTVSGVQPNALLAGQLCFNIADKIVFVGDGSDFKTNFNGVQVAGVPGQGWYSMPMSNESFSEQFVPNPAAFGDIPEDGQVLTWDQAAGHPIWTFSGGGAGTRVYLTTNDAVAAAPGTSLTQKINSAAGITAPDPYDFCVVTGDPGDVFQGLYYYSINTWVKCAQYAFPDAAQVPYSNTTSGLTANDVQEAIDENVVLIAAAQGTADQAFADAAIAQQTANDALPKAGGTMTGNITFAAGRGIVFPVGTILSISDSTSTTSSTTAASSTAVSTTYALADAALPKSGGIMTGTIDAQTINIVPGFSLSFNNGIGGSVTGVTDSVNSSSQILVPTANAVKTTYDYAATKLPLSGGTMTGSITFAAGQLFPISGIDIASTTQLGVVRIGTNIDVSAGLISVKTADSSNLGLVRVGTNIDVALGVISVKTATSTDLGLVQTGANIVNTAGVISVLDGTTSNKGVVQLSSDLISGSNSQALTASAGTSLQSQIDALTLASNVTLAGSLDAFTGLLDSVTSQGGATVPPFVATNPLPSPQASLADYYVLVTAAGSYSPPGGGGPYPAEPGDWLLCGETFLGSGIYVWQYLGVGARPGTATYTQAGIVQLADTFVTYTGTSDTEAVTPNSLQDKISDSISTTDSKIIASATAVKTAYDIGAAAIPCSTITATGDIVVGSAGATPTALPVGTDGQVLIANSACATGLEWVSDVPGDVTSVSATAPVTVDNTDPQNPIVGIDAASTTQSGAVQLNDTVISTSTTEAATANAVKTTYDIASAALPLAGGTMTGNITFQDAGEGVVFNDGSQIFAVSDSTSTTSSTTAASSTAVQAAYDLANAALARSGGTMTGAITFAAGQIFPVSGIQDASTTQKGIVQIGTNIQVTAGTISVNTATSAQRGVVQIGSNIDITSGTISVKSATVTQPGIVQLNDTTSSTSTLEALTANQGYQLQQQINALSVSNNLTFAGTIDGSTGLMLTVTTEGSTQGFVVGSPMPASSAANAEYFTIVTVAGTMTPPGGTSQAVKDGDWWLSNGTTYTYLEIGYSTPYASTTASGVVQLATDAQTQAGVNTTAVVVPSALQSKISDSTSTSSSTTIASSTAVKAAFDLANAAIPCSAFSAAGNLIVGTGAGTYVALPIGSSGQSLVVDSACVSTGGLKWGQSLVGYTCTVANGNTALGQGAGDSITTGLHNTSVGACAGTAISAGDNNTLVGWCTGDGLTSGNNNTVVGALAFGNTGGSNNTVMGYQAGAALTTGNSNVIIGSSAGDSLAGVNSVTVVGQGAMTGVATGVGTVAIGASALQNLTSGTGNVAIGYTAGDSVNTGSQNTIIGHTAGNTMTSATGNTILGFAAGQAITLGGANVFLGAGAGDLVTTGFNNTIIGDIGGSTTLQGNAIIAAGTTIKFQANNSGAWSYDGTNFGTAGQFLASQGSAATPVWCTLSLACVPCSAFTASGQLLAGTGTSTFTALPVGTNGQFLVADSTCTGGLKWSTECFVNDSSFTAKGDILVGTGAGAFSALPVGSSGQVLVVDTACTAGVKWLSSTGINLSGFTCSATPFNTAYGALAGGAFTVNSVANTAIGYAALDAETSGDFNVAIGHNALTAQNGASGNVAIGGNAGAQITSGSNNTLIGCQAGDIITTGSNNVAIGSNAHGTNSSGNCNTAVGTDALCCATVNNLTAVGAQALRVNTTGTNNVALGFAALSSNTTGSNLTAIGFGAGQSNNAGGNTYIGYNSGNGVTSGICNTLIGSTAGQSITTGACNTIVGGYTGTTTLTNNLVLAAGTTIKLQINENGAVGVGSTPSYGTSGQILSSAGTGSASTWTSSLPQVTAPTASTDAGVQGQIASDATYFYMYTGGRWQRIAWDTTVW